MKRPGRDVSISVIVGLSAGAVLLSYPSGAADVLADLLADYRAYGLPLPPEDAKLVRFEQRPRGGRFKGVRGIPRWCIGFMIHEGTAERRPLLLLGTSRSDRVSKVEPIKPDDIRLDEIQPHYPSGTSVFEKNEALAVAVQCKSRGWDALAKALLEAGLKEKVRRRYVRSRRELARSPRTALAQVAFEHWRNEIIKPDSDWKMIALRLRQLVESEDSPKTTGHRAFLESLEAALQPRKGQRGTIVALIDDLVDIRGESPFAGADEPDPRYTRILEQGFGAVPALIEHLDDNRLTHAVKPGFNNFQTFHLRVYHVVSDLLQDISGQALGKNWLRRQQGWGVEKADALDWWRRARAVGEEAYLLTHVLPADEKGEWPSRGIVRIIAKKYPQRLPEVYRTILDERPHMQSWPVAEAIGRSVLPAEKKIELFARAGRNKNLEHRRAAFYELKELDEGRFIDMLVSALKSLPRTPAEPYWKCREASFAPLVAQTDDPRAWKALSEAAARADAGLRVEMLRGPLYAECRGRVSQAIAGKRLDFLAGFLDDDEVRDIRSNPGMFLGPVTAREFPRLEIRNLAAKYVAYLLKMPGRPAKAWTPQQWAEFRAQVRRRLARHRAAGPEQDPPARR